MVHDFAPSLYSAALRLHARPPALAGMKVSALMRCARIEKTRSFTSASLYPEVLWIALASCSIASVLSTNRCTRGAGKRTTTPPP
eukprot:3227783-Rhodomonas_salina.1